MVTTGLANLSQPIMLQQQKCKWPSYQWHISALCFNHYICVYVCVCLYVRDQLVIVKQTSVTKKKDSLRAMALDSDNNQIQVKDVVKVVDGPHSVSSWLIDVTVVIVNRFEYIFTAQCSAEHSQAW